VANANRVYTVSDTVGGVARVGTWTITTGGTGAGSVDVNFNSTNYAALFNNTDGTPKTVTVAVTTVTDGTWTSTATNLCATPSYNITVKAKPTVSF